MRGRDFFACGGAVTSAFLSLGAVGDDPRRENIPLPSSGLGLATDLDAAMAGPRAFLATGGAAPEEAERLLGGGILGRRRGGASVVAWAAPPKMEKVPLPVDIREREGEKERRRVGGRKRLREGGRERR